MVAIPFASSFSRTMMIRLNAISVHILALVCFLLQFVVQFNTPVTIEQACPQKRVIVFLDISQSMNAARVDTLTSADLLSVAATFGSCGGELAFGLIGESQPTRLRSLTLLPRPLLQDTVPIRANAYEGAQDRTKNSEIRRTNTQIDGQWRRESEVRRLQFSQDVDRLLRSATRSDESPVCEATRRAERFLREHAALSVRRFAILLTDGEDTTQRQPCTPLSVGAQVILVKDGDHALDLGPAITQHVSSFASAVRFIETH